MASVEICDWSATLERPPGIHAKHGRYYLVHQNKWHPLTRVEEGAIPFWRAYYRLTKADPEFMAGVFLAFLEEGLPEMIASGDLKPVTAAKYESYVLMQLIPYCGHIHRSDINSSHVARYLSERKKAGATHGRESRTRRLVDGEQLGDE